MTFLQPFRSFSQTHKQQIKYVLTDIDDTLTVDGKLPAIAYNAMELLQNAGIKVIPITGRPAGWCDHFARMWPIDGLVGENGAFYFYYDSENRKMIRKFWRSDTQRKKDKNVLAGLQEQILREVPGCMVSCDQSYREADLAIDFCEDVEPLPMHQVKKIVSIFEAAGAIAKISSIHVNGWFGNYDKLAMTRMFFSDVFQVDLDKHKEEMLFSGDSPNDSPMFAFFPNSVGVANILQFADEIDSKPAWLTEKKGGYGFAEMVDILLDR
ncbi:MAG TPA: HAD-IIB family hydrolase [Desulfocapsa sulfexigens]|nr:HAD-IIB family hydrolase [Desulfocapsa sulfexigens]